MRRLAPMLLLLILTACAQAPPSATQPMVGGEVGEWTPVSPRSLEKWTSFPVDAKPRPLVLLGDRVRIREGFTDGDGKVAFAEGRVDADGKVPPEAAEAFATLTTPEAARPGVAQPGVAKPDAAKTGEPGAPQPGAPQPGAAQPGAGGPRLKVLSARKGTAEFPTDRGTRELPAWIFELTQTLGPIAVLAVKPDYQAAYAHFSAKVSADGLTLTVTMTKATPPCPGEPRITLEPQWLESPTAVGVGLKQVVGPVEPGETGNCAHDTALHFAEYPIRLDSPLGNRVLVDPAGNPIPVISS